MLWSRLELANHKLKCDVRITYCKEQPLELLAVALRVGLGVKRELEVLIVLLRQIEQDSGGLEDAESVSVCDGGNATVRVDLIGCREKVGQAGTARRRLYARTFKNHGDLTWLWTFPMSLSNGLMETALYQQITISSPCNEV